MEQICTNLTDTQALGTLASLQSTSSSFYNLVTPFLYRHIVFDLRQGLLFLDPFNKIPKRDKQKFLDFKSVDSGVHLLDQRLAIRLRSFMSYTRSLTLITLGTWRSYYHKDHVRLRGFHDLQNLLTPIRSCTPLWPILERCHIDLEALPCHCPWSSPGEDAHHEMTPLFDVLFGKLHPANMSIIVPKQNMDLSFLIGWGIGAAYCWISISKLHADHIELIGPEMTGILEYIPQASKSLTIRTDRLAPRNHNLSEYEFLGLEYGVTQKAVREFVYSQQYSLFQIDELRLIGLIKSDEISHDHPYSWFEERMMAGVPTAMAGLMKWRLYLGNKKDFRFTIMPDTSPESEAKAVWHTFKVPVVQ